MFGSCLTFVCFFVTGIWATVNPQIDSKVSYHNVAKEKKEIYNFFYGAKPSGFSITATGKDNFTSAEPTNLTLSLKYPNDYSRGRYVYCAELEVITDADTVTARVVDGGIGQENIKIRLVALFYRKLDYIITIEASGTRLQPFIFSMATILVILYFDQFFFKL